MRVSPVGEAELVPSVRRGMKVCRLFIFAGNSAVVAS